MTDLDNYLNRIGAKWLDKIDWETKEMNKENMQNLMSTQTNFIEEIEEKMEILFETKGALRILEVEKFFQAFGVTEWENFKWKQLVEALTMVLRLETKEIFLSYKITPMEEIVLSYVEEEHPEYLFKKIFDIEVNSYHYLERFEEGLGKLLEQIENKYDIYTKVEKELRERLIAYSTKL